MLESVEMEADLIETIELVLDEKVRPFLERQGGDVIVVGIDGDLLRIRMLGRCCGCLRADQETASLIEDRDTSSISNGERGSSLLAA